LQAPKSPNTDLKLKLQEELGGLSGEEGKFTLSGFGTLSNLKLGSLSADDVTFDDMDFEAALKAKTQEIAPEPKKVEPPKTGGGLQLKLKQGKGVTVNYIYGNCGCVGN
jgi:hypothetical protein